MKLGSFGLMEVPELLYGFWFSHNMKDDGHAVRVRISIRKWLHMQPLAPSMVREQGIPEWLRDWHYLINTSFLVSANEPACPEEALTDNR
jgi:hypothetical protein